MQKLARRQGERQATNPMRDSGRTAESMRRFAILIADFVVCERMMTNEKSDCSAYQMSLHNR